MQPIFRRNQEDSNFILIFREGQKAYRSNTSSTLSSASDDDQEQDDSCSSSYNDGQDHFPILSQNAATDKKEFVWRFLNKQFSELKQDDGKFTVNEDLIARITILFNLSDGLYEKRDLAYTINYLCEILKKGENLELTSVESDKLSSKVNQMSNVYINHYLI